MRPCRGPCAGGGWVDRWGPPGHHPESGGGWTVYARSTMAQGRLSSIDAAVARVRDEMMPAVLAADGSVGLSMLVNRRAGRCIVTSAWRTAEAATAEERMPPVVDSAMIDSTAAGGDMPEVED